MQHLAGGLHTIPDEIDGLLIELGASLPPPQRRAFEAAARAALAANACSGCGAAYRLIGPLQRAFWDPPDDPRAAHTPRHNRSSKLIQAEAIGADDVRAGARNRNRLRVG